jgi:hypothetical protein
MNKYKITILILTPFLFSSCQKHSNITMTNFSIVTFYINQNTEFNYDFASKFTKKLINTQVNGRPIGGGSKHEYGTPLITELFLDRHVKIRCC